ncbi:hypothetical protein [Campylobacter rectus]|uniref:hypothetical protein n=1 Tax=Campylobacter rectus TaxID=203 RepID=UPI0028ECB0CE|nr:hypothetical protein [Campylobacter rectus]
MRKIEALSRPKYKKLTNSNIGKCRILREKDGTIVILDVVNRQNAYASKEIFEMNKFKGKK